MFLIGNAFPGRISASSPLRIIVSDLQTDGSDDVSLLAVEIRDQGDVRRAVRIVFDLRNLARNTGLVALEIDDPVMPLVASAAATDRDTAVAVAAGNSLLWLEQ